MHRGYTKRWRKRWDKGYHKDVYLWLLMDYFIDHANFKDGPVFINNKMISLKRGQHIFGRNTIAELLGVNSSLIYRKLKILETINFLNIKSNNKFSIATVINYDTYQSQNSNSEQQTEQQSNSKPNSKKTMNLENTHFFEQQTEQQKTSETAINSNAYQDQTIQMNSKSNTSRTAVEQQSNSKSNTPKEVKKVKKEKKVKNKPPYIPPRGNGIGKKTKAVLRYLNKKKGSKFRDGTQITARLKAGAKVKDCITIIDNKFADPYFQQNPRYLVPATLFRKSHFDKYLNDVTNPLEGQVSSQTQQNIRVLKEWAKNAR